MKLTAMFSVLCMASLFAGCSGSASGEAQRTAGATSTGTEAPALPPALVRVKTVRREVIAPRIVAVGTVRARYSSIVASGSDGLVDEFPVELGDYVTSGTLLSRLRMQSTDLEIEQQKALLAQKAAEYAEILTPRPELVEEAEARQAAAEALYDNAGRRLEELRRLQQSRAAGESAVRDAEDAFNEATQNLTAIRAVYRRISSGAREEEKQQAKASLDAQQKYVEYLEAEKEKRFTRAPFDGYIVQRHSYVGQWLSKGSPVVTMARMDEVEVEVQIDQESILQITPGKSVMLKIAGAPRGESRSGQWSGQVDAIISRSDWQSGSRSFPVVIRIHNELRGTAEDPLPLLLEGMMAEAEFFGEDLDAILVPKDALVRTSRGTFVYAVNPAVEGKSASVRQVLVETGISTAEWIQVSTSELEAGVQVVTEGAERLRPFQSIAIVPEQRESSPDAEAIEVGGGPAAQKGSAQ